MPAIVATTPITTPAVPSISYGNFYLTQLLAKTTPAAAPCNVQLTRSTIDGNGNSILMPPAPNSTVNFNCDLWKEAAADTNIAALAATAETALLALVVAIATKRKLL